MVRRKENFIFLRSFHYTPRYTLLPESLFWITVHNFIYTYQFYIWITYWVSGYVYQHTILSSSFFVGIIVFILYNDTRSRNALPLSQYIYLCIIDNFPLAQVFIQTNFSPAKHFSLIFKSKNIFYTQSLSFSFKSDYQFVSHNWMFLFAKCGLNLKFYTWLSFRSCVCKSRLENMVYIIHIHTIHSTTYHYKFTRQSI